jgi:hypothetical protein
MYTNKHTQWYNFRVSNTRANKKYRFSIVNHLKVSVRIQIFVLLAVGDSACMLLLFEVGTVYGPRYLPSVRCSWMNIIIR